MAGLVAILLMPSPSTSYSAGTDVYVSDTRGFVYNVLATDIPALTAQGGVVISPRNTTATANPTGSNDYTQLYGVGSLWENSSAATLWMCTAMGTTPGSATWTAIAAGSGTLSGDGSGVNVTPTGATVAQTLANLFQQEWNNVKSFGAAGNGSTDDGGAIAAAITAAASNGAPVYFPPGTYKVSSTVYVDLHGLGAQNQGIMLIGAGMARSVIDGSGVGGFTVLMMYCSGGTAPSARQSAFWGGIRDLGVKGNYGSGPVLKLGLADTSDALNSLDVSNVQVTNISTSGTTIGTQINFVLNTNFTNLVSNCNQFGIALELNSTQFCNFVGGSFSTAYTGVHITNTPGGANAYTFANNFLSVDIENITNNCVLVDITNGNGHNSFYGGQFVWNYGGPTSNYAIASSASSGSVLTPPSTRFIDVNFAPAGGSGSLYGGNVLDPSNQAGVQIFGGNYGDGVTPAGGNPALGTTYTNTTGQAQTVTYYPPVGMTSYTVQVNPAVTGPSIQVSPAAPLTLVLRPGYSIEVTSINGGSSPLSWLWFPTPT